MKHYTWTDFTSPDITVLNNDEIAFYDHPDLLDLEPGDQILYQTNLGDSLFTVIYVERANKPDYDPDLRRVIATKRNS